MELSLSLALARVSLRWFVGDVNEERKVRRGDDQGCTEFSFTVELRASSMAMVQCYRAWILSSSEVGVDTSGGGAPRCSSGDGEREGHEIYFDGSDGEDLDGRHGSAVRRWSERH